MIYLNNSLSLTIMQLLRKKIERDLIYFQQLNALNKGEEEDETISVAEMRSLEGYDDRLKEVADYQFYVAYDFYAKNNSHFHRSPYYGYYQGNYVY